ncbi:Nadp-dependent alcohol dehydrogenase c 2, partial [Globisporangium splendens]
MAAAPRTVNAYAAFDKAGEVKPWQYESRVLGTEDIEIKISHCGICGSDIHALDSGWGPTTYPCVPGHEIVGEVTLVGDDVKDLAVGDRVGVGAQAWACLNKDGDCRDCADGADVHCGRIVYTYNSYYADGAMAYGGYADFVRVSCHYAFKIPEAIPSDVAAPLLCAGATVYTPLKTHNVKAGDRVGVIGIGGLGHLAIQFIRAVGATAIAFSRSNNKEQEVRDLGAAEFYNLSNEEDAKKTVGALDLLIITADAINMPYNQYMGLLRSRGTCVMVGLPNDGVQFSPFFVVAEGKKFVGSKMGSIADIKEMLAVAAEKDVRPVVEKLPMSRANEGLQKVCDGKVRYRVVLEN